MRASVLPALCLAALASACNQAGLPEPIARSVEPSRGYVGNRTPVVIRGEGFAARAIQDSSGGVGTVDVTHRAWLGGSPLEEVTWVDSSTLHATVPAGLPVGSLTLVVENPFGARGVLEDAFEVVATPGAALTATLDAGPTTVSVGQASTIRATVENVGTSPALDVTAAAVATSGGGAAASLVGPSPPSVSALGPGESVDFTWTSLATAAGELSLSVTASGTDGFSSVLVESEAAEAGVTVQLPAGLAATIVAGRATVSTGQAVAVTFTVTNGGAAAADVSSIAPSVAPGLAASCGQPSPPPPASIASGGSAVFTWSCVASEPGTLVLSGTAEGVDANSGAALDATPSAPATVAVQAPAQLAATLSLPPGTGTVSVGQALTLTLEVSNAGEADAVVGSVTPAVSPAAAAACGAPGPAPPRSVPGGGLIAFTWTCTPAVAGTITFGATVEGAEGNTGAPLAATASPGASAEVQLPAALAAVVGASPPVASVGQAVTVSLTVTNGGSASAIVSSVTPSASGTAAATCGAASPATPQVIPSGQALPFTWTCTPTTAGSLVLSGAVAGSDANSGATLDATPASPATVTVQLPAALTVSAFAASRAVATEGQVVGVTLTLANGGGATANVSAVVPSASPSATAGCTGASPAPPRAIAGGSSLAFTWTCTATAAGVYALGVTISATDANTGGSIAPAPSALALTVQAPAALSVGAFNATPSPANVGQPVGLSLTLQNVGGAGATVSAVGPTASPSAGTTCGPVDPALPQTLSGGTSRTFTWSCTTSSAGERTFGASVTAADANTGAALAASVPDVPVAVVTPASLSASLSAPGSPATVTVGEPLPLSLSVTNSGGAGASVTAVTPTVSPPGSAACGAPIPAPPLPVAGGAVVALAWTCTPAVAATLTFGAAVAGTDANTGASLATTASPEVTVTSRLPSQVTATVGASRAVATVGQQVAVTFTVANGGTGAAEIAAVTPSLQGASATCGPVAPAPPQLVGAGQVLSFGWTCTPTSAGILSVSATGAGTDVDTGLPLSVAPAQPADVQVQTPPALSASAFTASRSTANLGQTVGLTLTLVNGGGATADLTAVTPTVDPAIATCAAASPGTPRSLAGGGSATFTWSCAGTAPGTAALGVAISATDANTGADAGAVPPPVAVILQAPAALAAATFTATPATVTVGQPIGVSLTLSNAGGADAQVSTVTPVVTPPGAATCEIPSPAPPLVVAGGTSVTLAWTCTGSAAGAMTLGATAAGADANTGDTLTAAATPVPLNVLAPAALTARVELGGSPTSVSVGQSLVVTLTVENGGGAGASVSTVTPTTTGTATATCGAPAPAPPVSIAAGGSSAFTWTCSPTSAGTLTLGGSVAGADAVSGAPLAAAAGVAVTVQTPAALAATLSADRSVASVGQAVAVTLSVTNGGQASAAVTTVTPTASGVAASCSPASPAPPVVLPGGGSASFTWSCTPSEAGALGLGASVAGTDANSGASLAADAPPSSVTVQAAAALVASSFTVNRVTANTGQQVDLTLVVANAGGASASVSAVTPSVSPPGAGACTSPAPAPPQVIAGGASLAFTWSCTLTVAGPAELGAAVAATDSNSGAPAGFTATPIPVTIQQPAALAVTSFTADPITATAGQPVAVTLVLANPGGATANVTVITPSVSPAANVSCTAAAPAPPQPIAGGASQAFGWTCTATMARGYTLRATVTGTDANSGATLTPTVPGIPVTFVAAAAFELAAAGATGTEPGEEVVLVAADPLGDGARAPVVAAYRGAVLVGSGRSLVRLGPADGPPERIELALGVDAGPTEASNDAWLASAPATTLGEAGCVPGTRACGPDDEVGLLVLAAGGKAGEELVLLGGASERGTRYLHATASAGSPLETGWVDLRAALQGPAVLGAAAFADAAGADLVYLGLSGEGAAPLVLALTAPPSAGGRDAIPGEDLVDLGAPAWLGVGQPALSDVAGVLYAAGRGGIARLDDAGSWEDATPSAVAWAARTPAQAGTAGWTSAPPALAVTGFDGCQEGGCLYAGRNVLGTGDEPVVPQLWRCAPSAGLAACAPGDWILVAPDARDPLRTGLGGAPHGPLSLLARTARWLYVGFDGEGGVQLYRAARAPSAASDLEGWRGCPAGSAGCDGLGGRGFGRPDVTRIFGAAALTVNGAGSLWIAAGDGVGPASIFRIED